MKPFCEAVVVQLLPTVRALLARKLTDRGLKNKEVAALMGLTPPAVTQYLKKSRGDKTRVLARNKAINSMVDAVAERMVAGMSPAEEMGAFCGICREVRRQRILCKIHNGPSGCTSCMPAEC